MACKKCKGINVEKCDGESVICKLEIPAKCITVKEKDCCYDGDHLPEALESLCDLLNKGFTGTINDLSSLTVECGLVMSAVGGGSCCGTYTDVVTVGDFKALVRDTGYNYLVIAGIPNIGGDGLTYVWITTQLDDYNDEVLLSSLLQWDKFYYYHCNVNIMTTDEVVVSNNCQCTSPVDVVTVGDIIEIIEENRQNFLHTIVNDFPNFGTVSVAFLLPDDAIDFLNSIPSNTLIEDAFENPLFENAILFRFMTCTGIEFGESTENPDEEPFIDILEADSVCEDSGIRYKLLMDYENIPVGSTMRVYSKVGNAEVVVTNEIAISGNGSIAIDDEINQVLDEGNNYFRVVIETPDEDLILTENFTVLNCEEQPVPQLTVESADYSCGGIFGDVNIANLNVTWSWENVPENSTFKLYSMVDGVETEILSDLLNFATSGSGGKPFGNPLMFNYDLGLNYVKMIVTFPDNITTIEDILEFTAVSCEPFVEIINSIQGECVGEIQQFNIGFHYDNIPQFSTYQVFMLVNGIETEIHSGTILNSGSATISINNLNPPNPVDNGNNIVHVVITLPDTSIVEDSVNLEVIECP